MDGTRRVAERAALQGDDTAQARALTGRIRAGELARERVELAAYAGHLPAMIACPDAPSQVCSYCGRAFNDHDNLRSRLPAIDGVFHDVGSPQRPHIVVGAECPEGVDSVLAFATGLERFRSLRALPRAVVAMVRIRIARYDPTKWYPPGPDPSLTSLEIAQRFLDDPSEENRDACDVAAADADEARAPQFIVDMLVCCAEDDPELGISKRSGFTSYRMTNALRVFGADPSRLARVRSALIEWALG